MTVLDNEKTKELMALYEILYKEYQPGKPMTKLVARTIKQLDNALFVAQRSWAN